ncbi:MAG: hypothetical protein FWC41_07495, partial [Firmicutes bacterium]|nr:hypothetical protein [Bacillota bacterium]
MSFKQILKKGASVLVAFAFSIMPHAVSVSGVDSDLTTVIGDNFSATSYHNEEAFRVREIRDVSSGNRNDFGHVYFGGNECYVGRANTSSKRVTLFSKNPYSFTPFVVGTGPTTVSQGSYAESYVRRYLNPENVTGTIPTSGYVEATAGAFGPSSPAVTPNVESILKLADNRPAKNIRDDHFSDKLPEYEAILPAQGGLPVGDKFRLLTGSTTAAADLMDPVSGILINKMFIPTNSVTSKKIVNIRNGFANQSTGYALDTQTPDKEAVTLKMLLPLFDLDLSKVKYVSLRNGATVTTKFQNVSNINYGNTKSAELLLTIDDTSGSELGEYKGVDVNRSGKNITFKVTNLDNESVPLNTNEYISVIFDDGQSTELVKANVVGGMFNATSTLTGDELNAKILICKDNKNGNYSSSSVQDMTMQVSDYKITYSRELIKDLTGGGGGTTVNNPGNNKSNNK